MDIGTLEQPAASGNAAGESPESVMCNVDARLSFKMTRYFFNLILMTSVLSSCSIKYYDTDKYYYSRPVDNNVFTYKKKNFVLKNSIIDTTKIYCNSYPADKPEYFDCYRFFSTGQFISYRFRNEIDNTFFANINIGNVGYYHIEGNTIRLQEFYVNGQSFTERGGGSLMHHYGIIKGDSIIIDSEKISKRYSASRAFPANSYKLTYVKTFRNAPLLHPTW